MEVLQKIEEMLQPIIEGTDIFIVRLKIKPTNNVKVYLDADDGFPVSKSSSVNRQLRKAIDESGMFPDGDYSLEVSSPGIDEPLLLHRQYMKNVGRKLEVTGKDDTVELGMLREVSDTHITMEVPAGPKKKEVKTIEIPFESIKQAIVQISF
ncbi:ribosome maturation factor [Rurimicrobium arvi]|uniref:Ribosome maturation factor RimP n=1 Tax=Rurimicrobium arvi TaxID=2049916 RepID=A0ABP8MQI6_9BACT